MCTGYNKWKERKKRTVDTRVQRIGVKKMKIFTMVLAEQLLAPRLLQL